VKWLAASFAIVLAFAWAIPLGHAFAQVPADPLISPAEGGAGALFQVVGQSGWTPGETVTLTFGFADIAPDASYAGATYHERQVTVLRDGTWSFPVVVNSDLFPFPLWRPGFIVVRAQGADKTEVNSFVYTVAVRAPLGTPPLASFGFGPPPGLDRSFLLTLALFAAGTGALLTLSGAWRRRPRPRPLP
jgi:hypothetical protein